MELVSGWYASTISFRDREDAAHRLVDRLSRYRGSDPLILAIPRGGVVMGEILAQELDGELDVVLVRKLGAPGNPEYAIGAVSESGSVSLRGDIGVPIPSSYVEAEVERQSEVLRQRRLLYRQNHPAIDPKGRTVIVVDDGVATGATLEAALRLIREQHPKRLLAAVGVAPGPTLTRLETLADEVVWLGSPSEFYAVGQFFQEFPQVDDQEVKEILERGWKRRENRAPAAGGIDSRAGESD